MLSRARRAGAEFGQAGLELSEGGSCSRPASRRSSTVLRATARVSFEQSELPIWAWRAAALAADAAAQSGDDDAARSLLTSCIETPTVPGDSGSRRRSCCRRALRSRRAGARRTSRTPISPWRMSSQRRADGDVDVRGRSGLHADRSGTCAGGSRRPHDDAPPLGCRGGRQAAGHRRQVRGRRGDGDLQRHRCASRSCGAGAGRGARTPRQGRADGSSRSESESRSARPLSAGPSTRGTSASSGRRRTSLRASRRPQAGDILLSDEAFRRVSSWLAERGLTAEPEHLELKGFDGTQPAYRLASPVRA